MVRTVTLVDGPALKSAALYGRVARLSSLIILVSRHWSRSCMIFFWPQRCRTFDDLPDSRYLRYTREMVVRENQNSIVTSEVVKSSLIFSIQFLIQVEPQRSRYFGRNGARKYNGGAWIEYIMSKKKEPELLEELPSGLFPPERHIQVTTENFIDFTFKCIKYGPDPTFKEITISREQWAEMIEKYGAIENAVIDNMFQCMDF
ncbi:uncharacterized protein TNCV_5014031 [Trichonephila clavipes]|nr:uncharacterized protein TNCV_5014031 [Trichonephila clavipes]